MEKNKTYLCIYDQELNLKIYKFQTNDFQMYDVLADKFYFFFEKYIDDKSSSGVYCLINDLDHEIYIGQTSNILQRIKSHKNTKKFNRLIFFNRNNEILSKTYIDFLEWRLIKHFLDYNEFKLNDILYKLINSASRNVAPKLQDYEKSFCNEYFEYISSFLGLYGFEFDKNHKQINVIEGLDCETFYYKSTSINYFPKNNVIILLKGSVINNWTNKPINNDNNLNYFQTINSKKAFFNKNSKILEKISNTKYKLLEDVEINSLTFAAKLATQTYSINGKNCYKNDKNLTWKSIYQK